MRWGVARYRRLVTLTVVCVLSALALSGCLRIDATMTVSQDDTVSGEIVVATLPVRTGDNGPVLTIAPQLQGRARTQPYAADNYVGQRLTFESLTFDEVATLVATITTNDQYFRLGFRRSGDLVTMAGSADLTQVPVENAQVSVTVNLPGTVSTNGTNDNGRVTWEPKPGQISEFNATTQFTDTSGVSWTRWVLLVGIVAVGVSLLVGVLAAVTHRRGLRQER